MKRLALIILLFHPPAYAASEALKKAILMCESSNMHYEPKMLRGKPNPLKRQVRCGDDGQRTLDKKRCTGVSRGIAQFRKETFYEQAAVAIKDKTWPFGKPRWFSEEQQLWLLNDMLDRGMGNRWTCFRKQHPPMD